MPDVWDEMDEAGSRVEREARREQVAAEADARQLHLASRSLTSVAWEAMQQGRVIRLRWIGGELAGVPTAAVGDLIVVGTGAGTAGVNMSALASVEVTGERREGRTGDRTVESFVAWCRMIEAQTVTLRLLGGISIEGVLLAVAPDHLLVKARHGEEVSAAKTQVAVVSVDGDPFLAI